MNFPKYKRKFHTVLTHRDEISITKDMKWDNKSLKWKGIVDYILVFVFRPFFKGWIQPFAWFGTKGGAPGTVLLELVKKSIARLFQAGAITKASVCDGFSTNNAVFPFWCFWNGRWS